MKINACDFKGWTPEGFELLKRVLREAQHQHLDQRLAQKIADADERRGTNWARPSEAA